MQMDPPANLTQETNQGNADPMGGFTLTNRNSGGIEYILQGVGAGMNNLWNVAGSNQVNLVSSIGLNQVIYINSPMEPLYNFNCNKDWANVSLWGTFFLPADIGPHVISSGLQLHNEELSPSIFTEQGSGMIVASTQSSSKCKDIVQKESNKKGKKSIGKGRGKAKMIATDHKASQKSA